MTGKNYDVAPPSPLHQELVAVLTTELQNYIREKRGRCKVYPAPFAVFLNEDDKNYVEPDISVICSPEKLTDKGYAGAPDWVIEIVSPSSQHMDYPIKLFKYRIAGVREYWIINPMTETVQVYSFEDTEDSIQFSFDDTIASGIYGDFTICIRELLK